MEDIDVLVCGGGPAGLAAAVWLGRYRRRTLVVDNSKQRNLTATASHGYLTRDGCTPGEFIDAARSEAEVYDTVELAASDIVDRLGAKPVAIQLPIGAEQAFKGLVDLVRMKGVVWDDESLGAKYEDMMSAERDACLFFNVARIEAAVKAGARVFIATPVPGRPGGNRTIDPFLLSDYAGRMRNVAATEGAVLVDLRRQLVDPLAARRLGAQDRHLPFVRALRERQHAADLAHHRVGHRVVGLVDHDDVRDLHHAGLQRLDGVATAGH